MRAVCDGVVWYRSDLAGHRVLGDKGDEFFSAEAHRLLLDYQPGDPDWFRYPLILDAAPCIADTPVDECSARLAEHLRPLVVQIEPDLGLDPFEPRLDPPREEFRRELLRELRRRPPPQDGDK